MRRLQLSTKGHLSLEDFYKASTQSRVIDFSATTLSCMDQAFSAAQHWAQSKDVYGVSTGLGPMVEVAIPREAAIEMQYNLIRSHVAGMGEPLAVDLSRGLMLARLQSLTRNRSAVRGALVLHIANLFNAGIAPYVPRRGGVGASGDLVQLAHFALLVIGEGECWYRSEKTSARDAYEAAGLSPYALEFRDGLALLNGLSVTSTSAAFACLKARRLFDAALECGCVLIEILGANREAYAAALHSAKLSAAQANVAQRIREHLADAPPTTFQGEADLQAPYSLRCTPQIFGAFYSGLEFAEQLVFDELNSASDNPTFDPITGEALHGGNFHGDSVAYAMDTLKIAIVKCSLLLERQLNLLLNDAINKKLPPFLNLGRMGIDLGMQGTQFTATSTAAENQTLAFPASLHSIPSNKDNQDVVSMGTNASHLTLHTIDNAFDICAILTIAASQAVEALGAYDHLSAASKRLVNDWRNVAPIFFADAPLNARLSAMTIRLKELG